MTENGPYIGKGWETSQIVFLFQGLTVRKWFVVPFCWRWIYCLSILCRVTRSTDDVEIHVHDDLTAFFFNEPICQGTTMMFEFARGGLS